MNMNIHNKGGGIEEGVKGVMKWLRVYTNRGIVDTEGS